MKFRATLGRYRRILFGDASDRLCRIEQKLDALDTLVKSLNDIRSVPKAIGGLRLIQLGEFALLKFISRLFIEHNLTYWLDWGTLLGAVRHDGFIPWDDDVDLGMLRGDLKVAHRLLLSKECEAVGIKAVRSNCLRVFLANTPCQIDIFPWDEYKIETREGAVQELIGHIERMQKKVKLDWNRLLSDGQIITNMTSDEIDGMARDLVSHYKGSREFVCSGFEVNDSLVAHMDFKALFPGELIEFEGEKFLAPKDYKKYLEMEYGEYLSFPGFIHPHTDVRSRMKAGSKEIIKRFIDKMGVVNDSLV